MFVILLVRGLWCRTSEVVVLVVDKGMTDDSPEYTGGFAFLLGGQGTQYFGMARVLLEEDETFRSSMVELDRVAVELCGRSVMDYLYDRGRGFGDRCDDLVLTNLGLVMVEYSLARTLYDRGVRPALLVGSSLGEFVAVAVAGYLSAFEVLGFVYELACRVVRVMPPGGMIAVMTSVERFRAEVIPNSDITIASINNSEHFVISADMAALERARRVMNERGILYLDLPVEFAFHSHAVDAMASELRDIGTTMNMDLSSGGPTVYSSRTAAPLESISMETCWHVIRGPIHFTETITRIPEYQRYQYVDLSPSSSLNAILRSSISGLTCFPVITPFNAEADNLDRLTAAEGIPA